MVKVGEGHGGAMFRQGLRELRGAVYPESNVAQHPEYGLYGTRTPGEVAEARRGDGRDLEEENANIEKESVIGDRLKQGQEREQEQEKNDKDMPMDR